MKAEGVRDIARRTVEQAGAQMGETRREGEMFAVKLSQERFPFGKRLARRTTLPRPA